MEKNAIKLDIHDSEKRLKAQTNKTARLPNPNNKLILDFVSRYAAKKQLSTNRKIKLLSTLTILAENTNKPLNELTYKTIEDFIIKKQEQKVSSWTIRGYLDIIVVWLRQLNEKKYSDTIKKMSELKPKKYNKVTSEDLISSDEKIKLIQACRDKQEKAMLSLLMSSACRIGEVGNATINCINWDSDKEAFDFIVREGKTSDSSRTVRISDEFTVKAMMEWLNEHPQRKNAFAALFVSESGKQFKYNSLRKKLKIIKTRAGLQDKNLHWHLFRHTRLTELYAGLPGQVVKKFAGHSPSSKMEAVYSHLNQETIKDSIDLLNGKKVRERKAVQERKRYCLKCNKSWLIEEAPAICDECGLVLEPALIESKDKKIENLEKEIKAIKEMLTVITSK